MTQIQSVTWAISNNGILFDPGTAEYWRGKRQGIWNYEALGGKLNLGLDCNSARAGEWSLSLPWSSYGPSRPILLEKPGMYMLDWAADDFPIYRPRARGEADNANVSLRKMRSSYSLKQGFRSKEPRRKFDGTFTAGYAYKSWLG
ncbi:MAG: YHYH protein [Limisphaerales bacterium]|nr:MAG: YHYH protein [Limisphaerales bacterium]